MKRYFAMVLAVVLLCICTGAMAMGWGRTDNPPPTYTVTVTKLDKVATTSGAAYTPAPGKAATVGTVVYFTAKFADAEGNPVQGTINLTDMDVLYLDGDVVAAIVTGAYPAVRAVYKYTTPLAELTYDGKPVTISGDTVTIGSLTFIRRNGVAVDVSIAGGLADLTRELNALSMTLDDIYAGKIYMDDAALVANLGQHIKAEATAVWGADGVVVRTPDLPQTGSAPVYIGYIMVLAALALVGVRIWAKR